MNVDELLDQFRAELEDEATASLRQLSAEAVACLGLAPEWSLALAEAAGFPIGSSSSSTLQEWVDAAVAHGICRVTPPQPYSGDDSDRFWMPDPVNSVVFDAALEQLGSPLDALTDLARSVDRALSKHSFVWADSLRPWVVLATTSPYEAGAELLDRVRYLESQGDLHGAHRWIVAAQRLAPIMGSGLVSALRRAQRHIALHHRRRHDEAVLRDYISRPDLVSPFLDLLESESPWALHYLGDGGVGKTSLLRMLAAERSRRSEPLLFARVDFDHVSPEYPWRRPAQLLSLLADELEISALSADQQRSLDEFRRSERRTSEVGSASESAMSLDSREFEQALDDFAELLERLPGRAVLVLDTCEELAKFHEPGEPVFAVDFTFEILERLHALVPSTRVVFAGRRLLTRGGADTAGWRGAILHRDRGSAGERPYLDLCHVRGFAKAQAEEYLTERRAIDSASMRDAILSATEELDGAGDARHNPFDVALYAAWVAEDPGVTEDDIRDDDGIRYVEQRIVGRLERELDDVVPILVALGGRATPELLAEACGSRTRADAMHARLRLQEWIDPLATSVGEVLVVQPRLLERFRRYVASSAIGSPHLVVGRVQDRLRRAFEDGIAARPSELSPTTAVVAFGLLADERARSAWERLEASAGEHDEWNELRRLASVLLADESEGGLPASAAELRSLVSGSYATATAQIGGGRRQILDRLSGGPLEPPSATRSEPSLAEPAVSAPTLSPPLPPPVADRVVSSASTSDRARVERTIAAFAHRYAVPLAGDVAVGRFVTELETVLDEGVRHGASLAPLRDVLVVHERVLTADDRPDHGREIGDYFVALLARWRMLQGEVEGAIAAFEQAERALSQQREQPATRKPGWVRPDHPIDRVRLMYAESAVVSGAASLVDRMRAWYREACTRSMEIDANRLAARLLIISSEIAETPFLDPSPSADDLVGPSTWSLALHDRVPPLIGAVAIAEAADGQPVVARQRLAQAKRRLGQSDERLRRALELVELRLSIVDGEPVEGRVESFVRDADERAPLAAAWLAIHTDRFSSTVVTLSLHDRWRSSGPGTLAAELAFAINREMDDTTGLHRDELDLDLIEAELLIGVTRTAVIGGEGSRRSDAPGVGGAFDTLSWERRVRCDLRRAALGGSAPAWECRRAADLAAEEGALVAQRLPEVAVRLYDVASAIYSSDAVASRSTPPRVLERLGWVALTAPRPGRSSRLVRWFAPSVGRRAPILLFIAATVAVGVLANQAPGTQPSAIEQIGILAAIAGFYFAVAWLIMGRRFLRALGSLVRPVHRWPYWVAWRVELQSARSGRVSLASAERYAGTAYGVLRRLRLPSLTTTPLFERWYIRVFRRRMPDWEWSLADESERPANAASAPPPQGWRDAIEHQRWPVGVELVVDYEDEHRPIEREFCRQFGLAPEAPELAFFRRTELADGRIGHPPRWAVRRAGVLIAAPRHRSSSIASCWSKERIRASRAEFGVSGDLPATTSTTVYVVGTPSRSSAGWVMQVGDDGYAESSSADGGEWFGPARFRPGSSPRLVVLQPTPLHEVGAIADAREIAGCRQVAISLRSIGCPVVIVLPVVSERIADELACRIADLVSDQRLDRLHLMDVSVGVREFLAERLHGEPVDGGIAGVVSDFTIYTNR